jgi:hypothetical protein
MIFAMAPDNNMYFIAFGHQHLVDASARQGNSHFFGNASRDSSVKRHNVHSPFRLL